MEFTLAPSEDGQYIVTTVRGEVTRETAAQFIAASFDEGSRLGLGCHLVDLTNARNTDSVAEIVRFQFDDVQGIESLHANVCVALLVEPGDRSHDFYVALAKSTGGVINLFWDLDDAVSYLRDAAPRFNARL
jgi:hypothetical protein